MLTLKLLCLLFVILIFSCDSHQCSVCDYVSDYVNSSLVNEYMNNDSQPLNSSLVNEYMNIDSQPLNTALACG